MGPRKYFLDWLRVIAFGVLVFFHVGMLYVTWRYNLKSPRIYPALEWWMEATSPWRMALLFVISGVACRFLIEKIGAKRFAVDRLARLGVVILTGMLIVNPTQVWVQLISQGDTIKNYFDFWFTSYLVSDSTLFRALGRPMPTWDHLWFLLYLLLYTLLFAASYRILSRIFASRIPLWVLCVVPAMWMAATNVLMATLAPFTHALFNDWAAHCKWLGLFTIGTVLADRGDFWIALRMERYKLLVATFALLTIYLLARALWLPNFKELGVTIFFRTSEGAFGWSAVMCIAGFAVQYLDRPSKALSYLNDGVLPVYVLHQPVMLAAAYLVFPFHLSIGLEAVALVAVTFLGPLAIYHCVIRPFDPVRRLFGLKIKKRGQSPFPIESPNDAAHSHRIS